MLSHRFRKQTCVHQADPYPIGPTQRRLQAWEPHVIEVASRGFSRAEETQRESRRLGLSRLD
eukprot:1123629-Rhodomonas_salina.1